MSDELTKLRDRCARLSLLNDISSVVHTTLDPQQALNWILREAVRVMRASSGSAVLINPTNGLLEIEAAQGLPPAAGQVKLRVGEGITGWVAKTGQPACVPDVRHDPRYVMVNAEVRSELAVPLAVEGQVRGVLNVDSDRVDAFSYKHEARLKSLPPESAATLRAMAAQFAVAGTDGLENPMIFQAPEVVAAGGLGALKALGKPAEVLQQTKARMFSA